MPITRGDGQRLPVTRYWTRQSIIFAIQAWSEHHGGPPKRRDWDPPHEDDYPHCATVQKKFGSWNKAIEAAGLKPRPAAVPSTRLPMTRLSDIDLELDVHAAIAEAAEKAGLPIRAYVQRFLTDSHRVSQ